MKKRKSDKTEMWIEFIKTCQKNGVDLDFLTYALYEYCIDKDLSDWDFTEYDKNIFIDDVWLVRMNCGCEDE